MNQIKWLLEEPRLQRIIYFELAVWWNPVVRWRRKIDASHDGCEELLARISCYTVLEYKKLTGRKFISDPPSPNPRTRAYIKYILGPLNRRIEKRILSLMIQNHMHDMCSLHILKLLLIRWSPVFALADVLVATTVLDVAGVDGGCDGGCVRGGVRAEGGVGAVLKGGC